MLPSSSVFRLSSLVFLTETSNNQAAFLLVPRPPPGCGEKNVLDERALVFEPWSLPRVGNSQDAFALEILSPHTPATEEPRTAEATDDAVAIYLREIGRRTLLTSREEREIGRCVEDGRVLDDLAISLSAGAGGAADGVAAGEELIVKMACALVARLVEAWPLLALVAEATGQNSYISA
ncbi:MAG TPA: sigma-70 factor domain-containing protein, partial [Chloroflexota bacterium]|nr:sigma-70 factor domain-containing protein [Chloroflexota bacterium]